MEFLYPQFLWALAALSVPLIIHLFNFRRFTTLYFSDTRLLQNLLKQSKAINRLRQWIILLSRMLALAFLVIAFANPFIPAAEELTNPERFVSIFVDNSPSMTSGDNQSSKLAEMRTKAAELIKALPSSFKVQVLSNDFTGRQLQFYTTTDALGLVDDIEESYSSRSINEVMQRIEQSKVDHKVERLGIYLLSDFQKNAFANFEIKDSEDQLHLITSQEPTKLGNISIDTLWFYEPVLQPGFDQSLKTKVSYTGAGDIVEVPVSLVINNEVQAVQKIEIGPGESKEIAFTIRTELPGLYQGTINLDEDGPYFDNQLYFNFEVAEPFRVLLTGSKTHLNNFEKLFRDSIYQLEYASEASLDFGSLASYDLVIIDEPSSTSSGFTASLSENLAAGRNIVIIPGGKKAEAVNGILRGLKKPTLGPIQPERKAQRVSWSDPHFNQVFSSKPSRPALPTSNYHFKYPQQEGFGLINLEDGDPLVSRLPTLNGDLILFTSSLDSSGLLRHPLFVPILLNSALFSRENLSLYTLSGKSSGPIFPAPANDQVLAITLEEGNLIPRQKNKGARVELYELPSRIPPGSYPVMDGETQTGLISMNVFPTESQWNFMNLEDLKSTYGLNQDQIIESNADSLELMLKRQYEGTALWKWFILAAILFLLVELLLLKFWK